MAYINITGDTDGDLHDAAMHNNKFGAIASVLNGNINKDNLANPHSIYTMTFAGGPGEVQNPATVLSESWAELTSSTSAVPSSNTHSNTNSAYQVLMPSWVKVNNASTIVSCHLNWIASNAPPASVNNVGYLQLASSLTGSYSTTLCTGVSLNWKNAAPLMRESALTINSAGIPAGSYIRFVINNSSVNAYYPPKMTLTLTLKTDHVN